MMSLKNFLPGLYKLIRMMRTKKPDAVFTWMYDADFIGGIAAYLAGIRNIIWGIRNTTDSTAKTSHSAGLSSSFAPSYHLLFQEL